LSPLYNDPIPNPYYVVPKKSDPVDFAEATDPLLPLEQIPKFTGNYSNYSNYAKPPEKYDILRKLDKNVQINKHKYLVDGSQYKLFENGYLSPNTRNILKPKKLLYPDYEPPPYDKGYAWNHNNPISNGYLSSLKQTDFKTFGCYIHHSIISPLPKNLYTYSEEQLSKKILSLPMIKNGTINIFPKLLKNQILFNFYNRDGRYIP
jgi:hypothetical protein